jgi:hypothetical protein
VGYVHTCRYAALGGHLSALRANGCPWDECVCSGPPDLTLPFSCRARARSGGAQRSSSGAQMMTWTRPSTPRTATDPWQPQVVCASEDLELAIKAGGLHRGRLGRLRGDGARDPRPGARARAGLRVCVRVSLSLLVCLSICLSVCLSVCSSVSQCVWVSEECLFSLSLCCPLRSSGCPSDREPSPAGCHPRAHRARSPTHSHATRHSPLAPRARAPRSRQSAAWREMEALPDSVFFGETLTVSVVGGAGQRDAQGRRTRRLATYADDESDEDTANAMTSREYDNITELTASTSSLYTRWALLDVVRRHLDAAVGPRTCIPDRPKSE